MPDSRSDSCFTCFSQKLFYRQKREKSCGKIYILIILINSQFQILSLCCNFDSKININFDVNFRKIRELSKSLKIYYFRMEATYENFVLVHEGSLKSSGVPQRLWKTLYEKVCGQKFDAGEMFGLAEMDETSAKNAIPRFDNKRIINFRIQTFFFHFFFNSES